MPEEAGAVLIQLVELEERAVVATAGMEQRQVRQLRELPILVVVVVVHRQIQQQAALAAPVSSSLNTPFPVLQM